MVLVVLLVDSMIMLRMVLCIVSDCFVFILSFSGMICVVCDVIGICVF